MRKMLIAVLVLFVGIISIQAQNKTDAFEFFVVELKCPFCAYGLEKKIKDLDRATNVDIDFNAGRISFQYPANERLSLEAVKEQVKKAGHLAIAGNVVRADGTLEALGIKDEIYELKADKELTVKVGGNCAMCKARIEKAATSVDGVESAKWDKETKVLKVSLDPKIVSSDVIEIAIARSGHDTEHYEASAETYNELPGCCQYTRLGQKEL